VVQFRPGVWAEEVSEETAGKIIMAMDTEEH
jgi:hypothetical protein